MARKKASMQDQVEKDEQQFRPGRTVKTTAVINQLTVKCHEDNISFTALSLTGNQDAVMSDLVKHESIVRMTVDLEKPDKDFPQIEVRGKLKKYVINKTCDTPAMSNIQFSSNQVHQLTNYIRAEQKIVLKFTELEPELPFEESDADKTA